MRAAILILAGTLAAAPALAADTDDVLAAAKAYADAFNKGDAAAGAALCTGQAAIIDDFPPVKPSRAAVSFGVVMPRSGSSSPPSNSLSGSNSVIA